MAIVARAARTIQTMTIKLMVYCRRGLRTYIGGGRRPRRERLGVLVRDAKSHHPAAEGDERSANHAPPRRSPASTPTATGPEVHTPDWRVPTVGGDLGRSGVRPIPTQSRPVGWRSRPRHRGEDPLRAEAGASRLRQDHTPPPSPANKACQTGLMTLEPAHSYQEIWQDSRVRMV
jgi:hypothetical protein